MSKVSMSPYEQIEEKTHSSLYMLRNIRDTIGLIQLALDTHENVSLYVDGVTVLIDHAADEIQGMLNEILAELKRAETQKAGVQV